MQAAQARAPVTHFESALHYWQKDGYAGVEIPRDLHLLAGRELGMWGRLLLKDGIEVKGATPTTISRPQKYS
jgi:hypothetical protein